MTIEVLIFLLRAVLGLLQIERLRRIDGRILFTLFPFLDVLIELLVRFRVKIDLIRHEGAILVEELSHFALSCKLLLALRKVHDDFSAARLLVAVADRIGAVAVRLPMDARAPLAIGLCKDLDVIRDHVGGIKTEAEVTDDALPARFFILFKEVGRA